MYLFKKVHIANCCASCGELKDMLKPVNLAFYNKKDWKNFLSLIDDRDSMHATWKEWNKAYLKTKENLLSQEFLVREIVVDLDELQNYCLMRGIKIDGKARSQFVSTK